MSYIENIYKLPTRKLNTLSKKIVERYVNGYDNCMIQSAVIINKKDDVKRDIFDIVKNSYRPKFVCLSKVSKSKFWCSIQQIKNKYDYIMFLMYFKTGVSIYCIEKSHLNSFSGFRNYQHSGNVDEKQLFVTQDNFQELNNYLLQYIQYKDIFN